MIHLESSERKDHARYCQHGLSSLGIPEKSNQPGTFILAKFLAKESNSV
jgi:hypothetical protein